MSQTVMLNLPDATADWLKASASQTGRSIDELSATLFEEARRMSEFADIEFRTFNGERHACVKGHLQVWQLIAVAQDYDMDPEKTAAHFDWPKWKVQAALDYYRAFPEEIDKAIAENRSLGYEQLKRLFPNMKLIEVPLLTQEDAE